MIVEDKEDAHGEAEVRAGQSLAVAETPNLEF
jgi:hypothetical protein